MQKASGNKKQEVWTPEQYKKYKEKKPKVAKFRNKRFEKDGLKWDSLKEYYRWLVLLNMQENEEISELRRQVKIDLGVCKYIADFVYQKQVDRRTWVTIYEDVKSPITRKQSTYRLKKKLMKERHNIEIQEV